MNALTRLQAVVLAMLATGCAGAPPAMRDAIRIDHMVIPANAEPGSDVAAYAGFDNTGGDDRLLGVDCTCAASVELHRVVRDGDTMTMTNTFPLALPGAARTEVKPPGIPLHFMLINTTRTFTVGERVPMRLRFERAGTRVVDFVVAANSKDGWDHWSGP